MTSPDDTTPITRDITNACVVVPTEISGVVGVTANGAGVTVLPDGTPVVPPGPPQKSYYSSYGMGTAQVVAPGGDRRYQITTDGARGYVLSTWAGGGYALAQGTSMASPHAAGVAALIASMGVASPGAIAARLVNTADPMACPAEMSIYEPWPAIDNNAPQVCTGGTGYNSFNGSGQINALSAVSH